MEGRWDIYLINLSSLQNYPIFADNAAAFRFNNRYYRLLVDDGLRWEQVDAVEELGTDFPTPRFQWHGFNSSKDQVSFMLQADAALLLEVTTDST